MFLLCISSPLLINLEECLQFRISLCLVFHLHISQSRDNKTRRLTECKQLTIKTDTFFMLHAFVVRYCANVDCRCNVRFLVISAVNNNTHGRKTWAEKSIHPCPTKSMKNAEFLNCVVFFIFSDCVKELKWADLAPFKAAWFSRCTSASHTLQLYTCRGMYHSRCCQSRQTWRKRLDLAQKP